LKISLFNQRIIIEKNSVYVDKIGNHKNVWEEYFQCHAYVTATSYKEDEQEAAGQTVQDENLTFNVRYCSEISQVNAGNYRIRFQGNTYNIRSIDWMNYQNKQVKIKTTKERRE